MFHVRKRGIQVLFLLCQMAVCSACFWLWLPWTQVGYDVAELSLGNYVVYNAVLLTGLAVSYFTERDKTYFRSPSIQLSARNALWQVIFSIGALFVYLVGMQDNSISRLFLFTFVPVLFVVLALSQWVLPTLLVQVSFVGPYEQRILFVGPHAKVAPLADWLSGKMYIGCKPIGFLWDDNPQGSANGIAKLGGVSDLNRVIREWSITQVILAGFPESDSMLHDCTEICEEHGVRFLVFVNFEEKLRHQATIFEEEGLRFVGLRQEPLENPLNRLAKRLLDIAVSLPVVAFILPPTVLVVWLLQRRNSPGPIFFRQVRSGMQSHPFRMLKFRTMHVENEDESKQVERSDPRVFRGGYWLRRFSIDELPQFYNVLRGDMSVVGPRPHLLKHDELFARSMSNYHVRAVVKPGITGLAQVRGFRGGTRGDSDITNRVRSDIQYLETWTLELDCWIIFRTVVQMILPPKSAY